MIIVEDNRCKVIYARTNRRVQWKYSCYCGRWETEAQAIASAKEHFPGQRFEYRIEDRATDKVTTGFVDWKE